MMLAPASLATKGREAAGSTKAEVPIEKKTWHSEAAWIDS
jgi:hypothetical protein